MAALPERSPRTSSSGTERKIILFVALCFIVWSSIFIYQTSFIAIDGQRYFCLFDDAMISMRYAWNLSHGNGLVWNVGERVMGYTNLLMTLIMSLSTLLFDKSLAVLSIQILGIGLMLAIAFVTMKIADGMLPASTKAEHGSMVRILSFSLALLYYPLNYWTMMGMETGLLTLLLLLAVFFAIQYTKDHRFPDLLLVSLCLGLGFMARNDSVIFAVLIWIYILWKSIHDRSRMAFIHLVSALFVYFLFVAGQVLFQYLYYGELLPNTYTLKLTGMSLADRLSNGLIFVYPFVIQTGFLLVIVITALFRSFRMEKLLFLALFLSALAYQVYVGGDPWNYWRMMSPTMPLLSILFLFAVLQMISANTSRWNGRKKSGVLQSYPPGVQIGLLALMGVLVTNAFFLPEIVFLERPFYFSANQHNVNTAVALQDLTTPDATAGMLWAGAIPYYSERTGIDFLGKSDRHIASLPPDLSGKVSDHGMKSLPGHNKYDLNYSIVKLRPTFVQAFKWGGQDLSDWAESSYARVEYRGMVLYLLKNSPDVLWDEVNGR